MARKKGASGVATLINAAGFVVAAVLVMHIVFVLFEFPATPALVSSVEQAAVPLAMFFRGLIDAPNNALQVLLDFGLAAGFWVLVAGIAARIFG